jgi:hypothetical protein
MFNPLLLVVIPCALASLPAEGADAPVMFDGVRVGTARVEPVTSNPDAERSPALDVRFTALDVKRLPSVVDLRVQGAGRHDPTLTPYRVGWSQDTGALTARVVYVVGSRR